MDWLIIFWIISISAAIWVAVSMIIVVKPKILWRFFNKVDELNHTQSKFKNNKK